MVRMLVMLNKTTSSLWVSKSAIAAITARPEIQLSLLMQASDGLITLEATTSADKVPNIVQMSIHAPKTALLKA